MNLFRWSGLAASIVCGASIASAQLSFTFDYTYDSGFFTGANAGRQAYLNTAASYLTQYIANTALSSVTPSGGNTWTAHPFDPRDTGATLSIPNPTISANNIVVFVGAYDLPGTTLGTGGPGGWGASGNGAWFDTIKYRGNGTASMPATGSITFDSLASWYFDDNIATVESGLMSEKPDFFTVATHELLHLLGFGTSATWSGLVSSGTFTGSASATENGGPVILFGSGHWAEGTNSTVVGTGIMQETLMDPTVTLGTRKYLTTLDLMGLRDIGYTVNITPVPEPSTYALWAGLATLGWCRWRRRQG